MIGAQSYKYSGGSNAAERLHQVPKLAHNSNHQICLHSPKTYFEGMRQSIVKVNSIKLALKAYSSFDSPIYDYVPQYAERILNKIAKAINETFAGLKLMLQGFRIYFV